MPRLRSLALALASALALVPSALAAGSPDLVISQVFGGGGNAGAPFTNDYVELFNRGGAAVDLTGWSVQYATAAGTSWDVIPLAGTIPSGGSYLVQLASGGTSGAAPPAPDASGTTNLSAANGKVALVRDSTALGCGATAGSCSALPLVADLIGYGAAADYEGAAAPALSSTTAAIRSGSGCVDTDVNAGDFATGAPDPRNSAAVTAPCSAPEPPPTSGASEQATVEIDVDPVLAISLERATISFGNAVPGATPAAVSERVTVLSNDADGYALSVERTAFAPRDLPLGLQASAPVGGTLGPAFAGGGFAPVPIAPSSAVVGTTSGPSADAGDAWATQVGFATPLPVVPSGRYTATLTFTVIGR